jgi:hypothetical protein
MEEKELEFYSFEGSDYVNGVWKLKTLETGKSHYYEDFESIGSYKNAESAGKSSQKALNELYLIPEDFGGSDYAGSYVTVANHRAFLEKFGNVEGVYDLYGGFNTYAIAIRADVAQSNQEIREVLDSLKNYGVVDEETASEVEFEWQEEAMKYIVEDLTKSMDLSKLIPDFRKFIRPKKIESLAWQGIAYMELDWSMENTNAYIDQNKIKPYIEDRLLIDKCKDLPLLIGRKWSCEQTKTLFEQKLKKGK